MVRDLNVAEGKRTPWMLSAPSSWMVDQWQKPKG
jgi:hypothetical protein